MFGTARTSLNRSRISYAQRKKASKKGDRLTERLSSLRGSPKSEVIFPKLQHPLRNAGARSGWPRPLAEFSVNGQLDIRRPLVRITFGHIVVPVLWNHKMPNGGLAIRPLRRWPTGNLNLLAIAQIWNSRWEKTLSVWILHYEIAKEFSHVCRDFILPPNPEHHLVLCKPVF